jgi:hypothetical protein
MESPGGSWFDAQGFGTTSGGMGTGPGIGTTQPFVGGTLGGAIGGGGGPTPGNEQQWFMDLVGNRPWNQQTFNALAPTLQQYGFHITPPNANHEQTKIQLPDGTWVRVGFGEGHPVWIPQNNAPGQAGAGAGATGINSPWAIPPPFAAPSLEEFQKEPGLQARLAMGQQALERSAAAKGSLLSGGTQKALNRYSQDYASNEYANVYGRAADIYGTNFNVQSQTPWNRWNQLQDRGLTATLGTKTPVPLR